MAGNAVLGAIRPALMPTMRKHPASLM